MKYIIIDGDDIGRRITGLYLQNDPDSLESFVLSVQTNLQAISHFLQSAGFAIIFCAADGIAAYTTAPAYEDADIYRAIEAIGGNNMTFSVGVGTNLREAYVGLLTSKSNGKARLSDYKDLD